MEAETGVERGNRLQLQFVYDLNRHPLQSELGYLEQDQNQNQLGRKSRSESQGFEVQPPKSKRLNIAWADRNFSESGGEGCVRWICQVEGCSEDGAQLKDYHRRHRVCPAHARAPSVTLRGSNSLSRFCQQCSKFHALDEFDEDRRSCRRRLNRHNTRRRMRSQHNSAAGNAPLSLVGLRPEETRSIILALLHLISSFELAKPDPTRDHELVHRFLASLATSSLSIDSSDLLQRLAAPTGNPGSSMPSSDLDVAAFPSSANVADGRINDFDLNDPIFQEDESEPQPESEHENDVGDFGNTSPYLSQPSSNNSESSSLPSHASSSDAPVCNMSHENVLSSHGIAKSTGLLVFSSISVQARLCFSLLCEVFMYVCMSTLIDLYYFQCRTDKVVFKLFGKDLTDSPPNLRTEILTWLSHCPIEMESYMKPGCIILTLYLCLTDSAWHELAHNLASWIERLMLIPSHDFWRTGWVYVTLQDQMVFLYSGRLVLEGPLISNYPNRFELLNISPVAVSSTANVTFCLTGYNLSQSSARFFVAYDGEYLSQGVLQDFSEKTMEVVPDKPEAECVRFSCNIPASYGRGFIEIEENDHGGFFFPFIVADEAMCVEIRELESEINLISGQQNEAMKFLQEMGWLLRRAHHRSDVASYPTSFSIVRYRLLMSFAIDHEWCSVLKKLLDILFNGDVHLDGCSAEEFILHEGLLFETVRKKSKPLVAFLLRYKVLGRDCRERYLFTPDMVAPSTNLLFITPLHLAATMDGAETVLDALTDDPGKIGIKAWMTSWGGNRQNQTPAELARERSHTSYIQLVQNKIDLISKKAQVNAGNSDVNVCLRGHLDIEKGYPHCKQCMQQKQVPYRSGMSGFLVHRPAVLTLVCIAAVCVCVGIILKTPPFVKYIKGPFLWDSLEHGTM